MKREQRLSLRGISLHTAGKCWGHVPAPSELIPVNEFSQMMVRVYVHSEPYKK